MHGYLVKNRHYRNVEGFFSGKSLKYFTHMGMVVVTMIVSDIEQTFLRELCDTFFASLN